MKKLLILSVLSLCSFSAFACPNLAGRFTCKDFENGATQDVTITQSAAGGVTTYEMTVAAEGQSQTHRYVANGQPVTIENPEYTSMKETSTCQGNNLNVAIDGVVKASGETLRATMVVNMTADGNMYDSYIGTMGNSPIHFEEVCQRIR